MGLNATAVSAPESQYVAANNNLTNNIGRIADLVSNLRNRLAPVLLPGGDEVAASSVAQAVRAVPAPLVAMLEHHADRADNIGDEINDLLHRLCL